MKYFGIAAVLFLTAALLVSGCTTDTGDIDTSQLAGDVAAGISGAASELGELSGQLTGDETQASGAAGTDALATDTGGEWVLWNVGDSEIDISNGGYSYFRPNLNSVLFKDLKIEIKTENDAPVDLRITTADQLNEYVENWADYYVDETSPSFDPNASGYVEFYGGVTDETFEVHGDEGLTLIIESHADMPAKGIINIYYKS